MDRGIGNSAELLHVSNAIPVLGSRRKRPRDDDTGDRIVRLDGVGVERFPAGSSDWADGELRAAATFKTPRRRRAPLRSRPAAMASLNMADALNLSRSTLRMSRTMLKDICPEALELLKDKPVAVASFSLFKHVKPLRQIATAELMNKVANYSKSYAAALVSSTKSEQLAEHGKEKRAPRPKPEDLAKMEIEMQSLEREILLIDENYGRDVVNLTIARGYVKKLLENSKVVKYLGAKHADLLAEFQRIQEAASLET